jgi:radical SAM superfamily enzyme
MELYRRYGQFLRETFGSKVYKVSVDAGFTCPVLDGTKASGGCAYCNNASFKAKSVDRRADLRRQIAAGIKHQHERYGAEKFIVYFQNFTNTYGDLEDLRGLYETALSVEGVVGPLHRHAPRLRPRADPRAPC